MSVIKNKRTEGSLTIVTKAAELMVYTVTIASNEKHFPKRYRWCVTQHIVSNAVEINNRITEANGVYVETPDDFRLRKGLQKQALAMTYSLLSMIDMAYRVFQIDTDRIKYWTGLIAEIQRLLRNWRRSDDSRYANLTGDVCMSPAVLRTPNSTNANNARNVNTTGQVNNNNANNSNSAAPDCEKSQLTVSGYAAELSALTQGDVIQVAGGDEKHPADVVYGDRKHH